MEEYIVNGITYSKNELEQFAVSKDTTLTNLLEKNPNIQAKTSPVNQSAFAEPGTALNMGLSSGNILSASQEDDTAIERLLGKNVVTDFFGDIYRAAEQGFEASQAVGENLDIYNKGVDATDAEIIDFINKNQKVAGTKMSDEMIDFQRIYEEEGKGVWGFIKGVINNPTVIPQVFTSSMTTLAGSFFDAPEVAGSALAGAGTGAAIAGGATLGAGALPGGVAGFFGGLGGAMEAGLTFGELLQDELRKEGKEFSLDNVKAFLADTEKYNRVKRRAVGRGLAIGAIEGLSGGLAGKAFTAAGRGVRGAVAAIGTESIGGGIGEVAGRVAADQEMDVAEIGFEAVAGTATAPINIAAAAINKPTYKINNKNATREDVLNQIDAEDRDFIRTNFEIKNDPQLNKQIHDKKIRLGKKAEIETVITNPQDLEKVLNLETELELLGTPTTTTLKRKKAQKQKEIDDILSKYDRLDPLNLPAFSPAQKFRDDILSLNIANTIQFAKDSASKLNLDVVVLEDSFSVIEYLDENNVNISNPQQAAFEAAGFIHEDTIYINKDLASSNNMINVGAHELLHGILEKYVGANQKEIVAAFKGFIGPEQTAVVQKALQDRDYTPDQFDQEFLTVYSDLIAKGDIKYNQNIFTQIGDWIVENVLRPLGFNTVGFENGRQVYNFMKEYQKSIAQGGFTKSLERAINESGVTTEPADIQASPVLASRLDVDNARVDALVGAKDNTGNYTVTNSEWKTSGVGNAYMEIIDGSLLDGLIRSYARDPNTNTILDNVYGRSLEQFIEDVKTGETVPGITTLTDTIMNFNPEENNSLIGWINNQLRFRVADVVKKYKETQLATGQMQEAAEQTRAATAAPETTTQVQEQKEQTIKPLNKLNISPEIQAEFRQAAQDFVIANDASALTYKKLTDISPNTTKKIFGPLMTDKGFFIKKNAKILYDLLPFAAGKMVGGAKGFATATGIKRVLLDNFYTREGRATLKEGTAAGLEVRNKKPFNENSFLEVFGLLPNQEQNRNQKTAISSLEAEIGKAISNSLIREALTDQGVENAIIQRIADGKSDILFSKVSITSLDDGIKYSNETKEILESGIFPEGMFKARTLLPSKRVIDSTIREQIRATLETINYGKYNSAYGKTQAYKHMGNNLKTFLDKLKKDPQRLVKYNAKTEKMGRDFWSAFNKAAQKFPNYKETLSNMVYVSQENRDHPHPLMAEVVGYDKEAGNKKLRYEHAVPVGFAADYLIEAAFNKNINFSEAFDLLMKKYKQVAFNEDATDIIDKKAGKIGMPKGWDINKDSWTARYDVVKNEVNLNNIEWIADGNNPFLASKPNLNKQMNEIIENAKGIPADQIISDIQARQLGKKKDRFRPFVPFSAEDYEGLMYYLYGKGEIGNQNAQWFKDNFYKPLSEGLMQFDAAKQKALEKLKVVKKEIKNNGINLQAESEIPGFTIEQAIRVRMWTKKGYKIPGIDKNMQGRFNMAVRKDMDAMNLVEKLDALFPDNLYAEPENNWLAGSILTDVIEFQNDTERKKFLQPFFDNIEEAIGTFGQGNKLVGDNVNKLRAAYGNNYIKALENILTRIRSGKNRIIGPDDTTNAFMDWINNSVGTIMFFNTRSALLQTISNFNYINWSDNNALKAGQAWLNQGQFWKDFAFLYNSDFLKARRSGLRTDVNADEIARATEGSSNKVKSALAAILKKGFLPTQIADSFAIALGGASFYRNRLNKYLSEGKSQTDAENQTFLDFQELTEAAQQSSRPDRISMQQAGPLGRVILAFQNTPMQYTRLIKKSVLDLINRRGDWKSNLSKIVYYGAVQNIIFHSLQTALFALAFDDEEDDEVKERYFNIGNRVADSLLIGTGVYGAIAATTKNVILEVIEQEKGRKDFQKAAIASTALSPPINSKLQKLIRAGRRFTYKQEREKIAEMGLDTKNPAVISAGEVLSAVFNLPADRAIRKWNNLVLAADSETELWQSVALALGYSEWDVKLGPNQKEPTIDARIPIQRQEIKREEIKREEIERN